MFLKDHMSTYKGTLYNDLANSISLSNMINRCTTLFFECLRRFSINVGYYFTVFL